MNLLTIQADSMPQALAKVKEQLGDQAVILHTKTTERKHVCGILRRKVVEITAARDHQDLPPSIRPAILSVRGTNTQDVDPVARTDEALQTSDEASSALGQMEELKAVVAQLVSQVRTCQASLSSSAPPPLEGELYGTYQSLVENEVAEEIAELLVRQLVDELGCSQLGDRLLLRSRLAAFVESMVPEAGEIKLVDKTGPTLVALVGPTGVGKTTTVAKLAAAFSLRKGKKVGLITNDTYRIAAVQQLRTYAEIIGVPLHVVDSPEGMPAAVRALHDCDVVFIDTAGRSQNDSLGVQELACFLAETPPDEIHLVLAATSSKRVLEQAIDRFRPVGMSRVIFTKLDEAVGFGVMLACLRRTEAKLSYVTMGQNVPSDIEVADASTIAKAIVAGRRSVG